MLKFKLFKWFAGLVLVFGALSAFLGIWVIRQRVVQEAQTRVRHDLNGAWAVYQSQLHDLETIVRLTAIRGPLVEACQQQKWSERETRDAIQGLLGKSRLDFSLDFLTVVSPDGQVVARATPPYRVGDFRTADPLIARALGGAVTSGSTVFSQAELANEADGLVDRAFLTLQETPLARPAPRASEDRGMVLLAAAPIEANGRVIGVIYAGQLLNRSQAFVDRVHSVVFGDKKQQQGPSPGTVTVFLGDTRVATTVCLPNGNRAIGTRVSAEVAQRVLDNGASWADRAFVVQEWYLTAYDPVRDSRGQIIGMLYVGTLERPFRELSQSMILRYSGLVACALLAALLMAMFIAGRLARPLHRLAEGADRMRHGERYEPVAADRSCAAETASLIQAFNDMGATLTRRESELKDANERLEAANATLKATNASYMETLQFVSHELNSPLSSIMNYVYMMRQQLLGPLSEKQQGALEVVSGSLRRVMEMIRHYLNLARIESGEMQPVLARVAVRDDVIAPLLASLHADLKAKGMQVDERVGPATILHADLNMTRELFENLLGNAIKYGRTGGKILLDCHPDGKLAEFVVRNDGEGIPPERRADLFQKFSRLEVGDSKKSKRGTGLGLFICKKIVEAHGGTIRVESEPGQWTEFRCTLPLQEAAPPAPPAEAHRLEQLRAG